MAFYILTGQHAFLRDTDYLTWQAVLKDAVPDVSDALYDAFVKGATCKDPESRILLDNI